MINEKVRINRNYKKKYGDFKFGKITKLSQVCRMARIGCSYKVGAITEGAHFEEDLKDYGVIKYYIVVAVNGKSQDKIILQEFKPLKLN